VFEELGLLEEAAPVNPYDILGLNPGSARELIGLDNTGDSLRIVVSGLHRAMSRLYHPDTGKTANVDRFGEITRAKEQIDTASAATLLRWSKQESSPGNSAVKRLQESHAAQLGQIGEMLLRGFDSSLDPKHFAKLEWAQGLLIRRDTNTALVRQKEDGGLQMQLAKSSWVAGRPQVEDFHNFLENHQNFGIEPGTDIAVFIDENKRSSILSSDLTFMMDVTGPIRELQRVMSRKQEIKEKDLGWSHMTAPTLTTTTIRRSRNNLPRLQQTIFSNGREGTESIWDIPFEVAGSFENNKLFNQVKHSKAAGAAALMGSSSYATGSFCNFSALPITRLSEPSVGYTPLLQSGNSLMLYDTEHSFPVVTDALVVGVIGSAPYAK
jgi:hypothetical protein